MKQNQRIISMALIGALALSLAAPTAGFAAPKKYQNQEVTKKQGPPQWVLEKFETMKHGKVKYNGSTIKFDTDPINKGGRILIPLRALTEGMGCDVLWEGEEMLVTVTHPDSATKIVFDLDEGTVEVNGKAADIDVKAGLHNNSTYVPLRFIAETFGLDMNYNNQTGDIDMTTGPSLNPAKIVFKEKDAITKDVEVKLLNLGENYDFKDIKDLNGTNYTEKDGVVTLEEAYLEGLKAENTTLVFRFEDENDKVIERTLNIVLEYNKIVAIPVLNPVSKTFTGADMEIVLPVNYTLVSINKGSTILENNTHYSVSDGKVTLDDNYLKTLTTTTELKFTLKDKDNKTVEVSFTVKI